MRLWAQRLSTMMPASKPATTTSRAAERSTQRPIEPRSHQGSQEIGCGRSLATGGSPDREGEVEVDAKLVLHAAADQLDHRDDVLGHGAGLHHHVVGVAVIDLGSADACAD